ncbi:bacteriophage T4 gp5 trimerisation domain-containing protein [Citrobacter portucalensis]|uniref:bacteriophage T4 gp5 trimerisation domain-containing protein n=1 Tax=Citrobacter portucalensis TaxID=1639133 RepID=UPI003979E999
MRTRTMPQGNSKQGNELRFDDKKNNESIFVHAEKDLIMETNNDYVSTVNGKKISKVEKNLQLIVKEAIDVSGDKTLTLTSKENMSSQSEKDINVQAGGNGKFSAKSEVSLSGETIEITSTSKIRLKVGSSKIEISDSGINFSATKISIASTGSSEITGATINIDGKAKIVLKGVIVTVDASTMTEIKSSALVNIQGAVTKIN